MLGAGFTPSFSFLLTLHFFAQQTQGAFFHNLLGSNLLVRLPVTKVQGGGLMDSVPINVIMKLHVCLDFFFI